MRSRSSLVDILVVGAVLLILMTLLLPNLAASRARSRRASCLAASRLLANSFSAYVANAQAFPVLDQGLLNETGDWMAALEPYGNTEKARQCPAAPGQPARPGNAYSPWRWPHPNRIVTGGYGFNGWLYTPTRLEPREKYTRPGNDLDVDNANPKNFFKRVSITRAEFIPVFSDAIWTEAYPLPTDIVSDLQVGSFTSDENQMGRFTIDRHQKKVDVSFYDGHAETVDIPKLWTLQWNAQWETPKVLPAMPE